MATYLSPDKSDCPVFVLLGNGGMGKTQIALRYINTHLEPGRRVLWIQSDSEARMQESFRSIARALGISDHGDGTAVGKQVLTRVSAEPQVTLLVYDNMDSIDLFDTINSQHLPRWESSGLVKVLITTRIREYMQLHVQAGTQVGHAVVEALERQDAITLLSKTLSDTQTESIESNSSIASICDDLGCLPLGIQQASSYITVTGTLPQQYLVQLREEPKHTLTYGNLKNSSGSHHKKTVWTVWEDSLWQIEMRHPFAAKLFCLCGFLGTDIPYSLFHMAHRFFLTTSSKHGQHLSLVKHQIKWIFETNFASSPWTTARLHLSAIELQNFSMAKTSSDGDGGTSLTLHTLVQQWIRLRLPLEQQRAFISMAASLIYSCAQELQSQHKAPADSRATYLHQRHLLTHAYSCIEFSAKVLGVNIAEIIPLDCATQFAMLLIHEREYASAEQMLRVSRQVAAQHGSNHAEAETSALRALSLALRRQRKLSEALSVQQEAIERLHELDVLLRLPVGQALRAKAELATIYRDLKRYDDALVLQSTVVDSAQECFGESSLETLHEMSCLGILAKRADDYQRALPIEEKVLHLYEEHFPGRLEMWDAMRSLAITYYYLGRDGEAIKLELRVLAAKTKLYGPDHLETASAMQNLATTYKDTGDYQEASRYYSEALKIRQSVLGSSDDKTRKTARHLAEVQVLLKHSDVRTSSADFHKRDRRVDSGISMDQD